MKITIETIDHNRQRYNTVGDWLYDPDLDELTIFVSKQETFQYELAVGVHELVEAVLCINDGVSQKDVDAFDFSLPKNLEDEPGDLPDAPYANQHCIATGIERLLIACFGLQWKPYDDGIVKLSNNYRKGKVQ